MFFCLKKISVFLCEGKGSSRDTGAEKTGKGRLFVIYILYNSVSGTTACACVQR